MTEQPGGNRQAPLFERTMYRDVADYVRCAGAGPIYPDL